MDNPPHSADPWALEREREQQELAFAVVRAERSMARQRARGAMRARVVASAAADLIGVVALFLPWVHVSPLNLGYGQYVAEATFDGVRLPWVLGLGLVAAVVRQIALVTAFAQPDRRLARVLYGTAMLTVLANITMVVGLPFTAATVYADSISTFGPMVFGGAATAAAVWTFVSGWRMSRALVPPNLLEGMNLVAPEHVSAQLGGVTASTLMRFRGALVDRPCLRILGGVASTSLLAAGLGWLVWPDTFAPLVPALLGVAVALGLLGTSALWESMRRDRMPRTALVDAYVRLGAALRPPDQPYYVYV